ncbi:recombination protein RecR [candidate division WOR-3 bacterium]|jgi:recombination protein RecR|nr:recombination protein RecR [candidate division WOR-3 bacterium]
MRLTEALQFFPGIGKKSAERIAFYILSNPRDGKKIAESVEEVLSKIKFCNICGNITVEDPCSICSSHERNRTTICVVEKPMDVFAIERAGIYDGLYHVLGGLISPLDNRGPDEIRIEPLILRAKKEDLNEIIIATNPTTEGEATALYLQESLKEFNIKISRIAQGIPVGTDLDFADDITLLRAMEGRREFKD